MVKVRVVDRCWSLVNDSLIYSMVSECIWDLLQSLAARRSLAALDRNNSRILNRLVCDLNVTVTSCSLNGQDFIQKVVDHTVLKSRQTTSQKVKIN